MLFPRTGPGAQFVLPPSCNDMSQKVIFKLCVQIKKNISADYFSVVLFP